MTIMRPVWLRRKPCRRVPQNLEASPFWNEIPRRILNESSSDLSSSTFQARRMSDREELALRHSLAASRAEEARVG
jgi:hypothetical protein